MFWEKYINLCERKGLSPAMVKGYNRTISAMLTFAVKEGMRKYQPLWIYTLMA